MLRSQSIHFVILLPPPPNARKSGNVVHTFHIATNDIHTRSVAEVAEDDLCPEFGKFRIRLPAKSADLFPSGQSSLADGSP
jgi:hypothetical protein